MNVLEELPAHRTYGTHEVLLNVILFQPPRSRAPTAVLPVPFSKENRRCFFELNPPPTSPLSDQRWRVRAEGWFVFHFFRTTKNTKSTKDYRTKRWMLFFRFVTLKWISQPVLLTGGFPQPRTRLAMNLDHTADHPVRPPVNFHPSCPFVRFVVQEAEPSPPIPTPTPEDYD